jgi:extradiol dioxygenase family protein
MTSIFHLSLPVKDFEETRSFYCNLLNGVQEKTTPEWFNVNLKGHQLTFHLLPEAIISSRQLHWGLVISWDEFHAIFDKLKIHNVFFTLAPDYQDVGTPAERVKMIFTDPSNYLIEFKAYKHDMTKF